MLGKTIALNIHYRPQLLVGTVLAIWLYLFLVLVGPFDAAELPLKIRVGLMVGYGLVFFLCYALVIPIQNKLYHHLGKWKLGHEIAMVMLFCTVCLPISFAYYKSEMVNGDFSFEQFTLNVYLPTIAIVLPAVFVGRYLAGRHGRKVPGEELRQEEAVILSGERDNAIQPQASLYQSLTILTSLLQKLSAHQMLK